MEKKINLLDNAQEQITKDILESMEERQEIKLNKRFTLYKYSTDYCIGYETDEKIPEYFVLTDNKYDEEETFCVQYGKDDDIILTDVWGYDDDENFTN